MRSPLRSPARSARARRPRPLSAAALAIEVAVAVALTVVAAASATTATPGIVQRDGTQLVLDGSPYRFTGYQIGLGASPAHPLCTTYSDTDVARELAHARTSSGANAVRVWMFQGYGGPQDWTRFDLVFSEARKAGVRVVATLTNQWGDCEPSRADGTRNEKRLSWYQAGYRSPDPGYALSYRDFVAAMADRYRAEPALLAWQLVNEAEPKSSDGTCDEQASAGALRAFSDDVVGVVRAAGDPHLVGLGSIGSGQCGLSGSADYRYVHAGALDMCEYHDYTPMQAVPGDAWNGLATRVGDCAALGKPLFVGEAGIPAGIQSDGRTGAVTADSLVRRAALFDQKLTQQMASGVTGFLVWQRAASNNDGFTVSDGDPLEGVLLKHTATPAAPAPTAAPTVAPMTSPTAAPKPSPTPTPTPAPVGTTATTAPVLKTVVLTRSTGSTGLCTIPLRTGSGRLVLTAKSVKASTVTLALKDPRGRVIASARGALPLVLAASVPSGRQAITVTGPRYLAFTLVATYVSP